MSYSNRVELLSPQLIIENNNCQFFLRIMKVMNLIKVIKFIKIMYGHIFYFF